MANESLKENRILATPVVVFLLAMLGFPAVLDLIYSVSTVSFENLRDPTISGFGNYREVLGDPYFWSAVSFSTRFGLLTAALETALGLFLAVFLAPLIHRRFWLMAIFMMPMIIAPSMMGLMYRLVLHEFVGPLPYYLFEFFGESPAFLSPQLAFRTLVVIETLQWTPFTLLLFYTAYSSIPNDIREAAKVDGTRGLRLFTHIELPALLPTLVVAFGIRFIDGFRVFDNIYVLIGSGAGGSSTSLSIYIYTAFFKSADIGKALAASVLLFVVAFGLLWLVGWLLKKRRPA
ncbi:carbohydrate ABC transporter permease [Cohaesibacter haloalkalitolerans]|uniref:carbohydrate ABC transporter permease n=1 Tax=Cohaesibacter haloalkalitolerans TaxID=1162980 RepID=UPI003CCA853F